MAGASALRIASTAAGRQCGLRGPGQRGQQGAHCVGEDGFSAVRRAVGCHDGHRVADPLDEVGDDQSALGEVRILAGQADLRGAVRIARQDR
jgi:hypothetical protein